jgi:ankyrin repeat protein
MSDALRLPPRPNLEQYKKLARDFQAACKSDEPHAIRIIASQWVKKLVRLHGQEITPQITEEIDREARRIDDHWKRARTQSDGASRCTLAAAQFFIAREHGFASWPRFSKHLTELRRADSRISRYETAVEAIINGDVPGLKKLLRADPDLIKARSTREHRSTLLHYVSANGVEDFRQKTPKNIVEITRVLLDAGAEVDAESDAYGGGCTALGLVATSIHPEKAGVQIILLETLLNGGARKDLQAPAGKGHSLIGSCLANGQPGAAEFFAGLGVPVDLEAAAGLGRLELLKRFFDEAGGLRPPSTRKKMDSAFFFGCWYGRKEVVEFLLERGVDPSLRNDGGQTGLHCCAYVAETDVAKVLIQHGAPVDAIEKSFNATPLDVALWAWNNARDRNFRERCYDMVALLVRTGATLDPQHWTNPDGSSAMLDAIHSDIRMEAALQGKENWLE